MREAQARTDLVPTPQTVPLPPPAPAADTGGTAAGAGRGKGGVGGFSVEWNLGANAVAGRLILRLKMQVRAYPPASPTVFLSFTVANCILLRFRFFTIVCVYELTLFHGVWVRVSVDQRVHALPAGLPVESRREQPGLTSSLV